MGELLLFSSMTAATTRVFLVATFAHEIIAEGVLMSTTSKLNSVTGDGIFDFFCGRFPFCFHSRASSKNRRGEHVEIRHLS